MADRGDLAELAVAGGFGLLVAFVWATGLFAGLERWSYDGHLRARPTVMAEAAIVAVDAASRSRFGGWPWPDAALASLVDRLQGVRLVVLPLGGEPGMRPRPHPLLSASLARHGRVIIALRAVAPAEGITDVLPLPPELRPVAAGVGVSTLTLDSDRVVRSWGPGPSGFPSLVQEALRVLAPAQPIADRNWIRFAAPQGRLAVVPVSAVLAGEADLRGKLVFVGRLDVEPFAQLATPLGTMAPVAAEAQAVVSSLRGEDLRPLPWPLSLLAVLVASLAGGMVWLRLSPRRALGTLAGASAVVILADAVAMAWAGYWLPWPSWLVGLWGGFGILALSRQAAANRKLAIVMDQLLASYKDRKARHAFTTGPLTTMKPGPSHELPFDDKIQLVGEIARTFHQERSFFQMLLETNHQPVLVVDGDAKVFVCNAAGQDLLGKDVISCSLFELLAPLLSSSTLDEVRLSFQRAWLSNKPFQRFVTLGKNTFRMNLVPTRDVEGMLFLLEDVTALHERANTDALTGLWNRRFFNEQIEVEVSRARRYKDYKVSLVLVDVDHFKRFNDEYGHITGDRVLQAVANVVKSAVRTSDFAVRLGGEELAVLLTHTDSDGAYIFAERLRQKVAETPLSDDHGNPIMRRVTVSLGISVYDEGETSQSFLRRADVALYRSKSAGRNQVSVA